MIAGIGDFVDWIDAVDRVWDFVDEIDINDVIEVTKVNAVTKVNGVTKVNAVTEVSTVISVNMVIIALSHKFLSQLPAEGLVQQRLFQRRQRRELLLVEAGDALGFDLQFGNDSNHSFLFFQRRQSNRVGFESVLSQSDLACRATGMVNNVV